jgi:hypothetical protein
MSISFHRWVRISRADDYLRLGWLPLPTLEHTPHGAYSVHMAWLCNCKAVEPRP